MFASKSRPHSLSIIPHDPQFYYSASGAKKARMLPSDNGCFSSLEIPPDCFIVFWAPLYVAIPFLDITISG